MATNSLVKYRMYTVDLVFQKNTLKKVKVNIIVDA